MCESWLLHLKMPHHRGTDLGALNLCIWCCFQAWWVVWDISTSLVDPTHRWWWPMAFCSGAWRPGGRRLPCVMLTGCAQGTGCPTKCCICRYHLEFLCHDDTWVLLAETGIPANLQAASAPWVVCSLCPCSPACACCSIVHLPCVCGILALFIYVIKILHLCVTDTHLEVICKWLKQQWSEPVRSGPPRALPQQLKKCVLQKMLT